MKNIIRNSAIALASSAVLATAAVPKPAMAGTTGTVNTILGIAAVVGSVMIANNIEHKEQEANTVVGYTRNGGTEYADGRIVFPNGTTVYPGQDGQYPNERRGRDR